MFSLIKSCSNLIRNLRPEPQVWISTHKLNSISPNQYLSIKGQWCSMFSIALAEQNFKWNNVFELKVLTLTVGLRQDVLMISERFIIQSHSHCISYTQKDWRLDWCRYTSWYSIIGCTLGLWVYNQSLVTSGKKKLQVWENSHYWALRTARHFVELLKHVLSSENYVSIACFLFL